MPIGPCQILLRISLVLAALFTAGCAGHDEPPVSFGSVAIAEPGQDGTMGNRYAQLWVRVAHQAIENGHPDTAIRFAQKAVQAYPGSDEPLRILAIAYRQRDGGEAAGSPLGENRDVATGAAPGTQFAAAGAGANHRGYNRRRPYDLLNRATAGQRPDPTTVTIAKRTSSAAPVGGRAEGPAAYRIQLAAYSDLDDARRGRALMARRLPADFAALGIFARRGASAEETKVNYRLRSRDPTTRAQALAMCTTVNAAGYSCLPIRQTGSSWQLVDVEPATRVARAAPAAKPPKSSPATVAVPPRTASVTGPALFKIQLAAYRHLDRAVRGKKILAKSLPGDFPQLEIRKRNQKAEDPARINYWIRSRDVWDKAAARVHCDRARAAGHACLLIGPRNTLWPLHLTKG